MVDLIPFAFFLSVLSCSLAMSVTVKVCSAGIFKSGDENDPPNLDTMQLFSSTLLKCWLKKEKLTQSRQNKASITLMLYYDAKRV